MKLERMVFGVALGAGLLLLGASAPALPAPPLDSPQGLTLVAQGAGRYLLLWDPIYRDDLLGYSVWLRKPSDAEFVRLSVPVKVGKEVKKQPLTPEAKVVLAFGRDRDDLEMTVVTEYEGGSSPRAAAVRSAKARRTGVGAPPPAPAPADAAPAPVSPSSGTERQRLAALAAEEAAVPAGQTPWDKDKERSARPLILKPGATQTRLGVGFDYRRFIEQGRTPFSELSFGGAPIAPTTVVDWRTVDVRTTLSVPLTLRVGVFNGLEAWGRAAYHAEDYFETDLDVDGTNYNYIGFYGPSGQPLSNPTSTGLNDVEAGVRVQPLESQQLVIGLHAAFPTGESRFKGMIDWFAGRRSAAGTGEGILRLGLDLDWGQKGIRPGLSFHGGFSPGGDERYSLSNGYVATVHNNVASHGQVAELGGAYTFPWELVGRGGALALGLMGRSQAADRWTIDGVDQRPLLPRSYRTAYEAASGLKLEQNNQLEISLEAYQDLPRGFETGGRLSYTMEASGDRMSISGQLLY